LIFGTDLFGEGLFSDTGTAPIDPPIQPPTGQTWIEQCPAVSVWSDEVIQADSWSKQTKQGSSWIAQPKATTTTDKCNT